MAGSCIPGTTASDGRSVASRTPGPLGFNDQADPDCWAASGDTPGSLGVFDRGEPAWLIALATPLAAEAAPTSPSGAAAAAVRKRAPWMDIAEEQARKFAGKTEDAIEKTTNFQTDVGTGQKTMVGGDHAWCAAFVNYCLREAGYPIENPTFADRIAAKGRAHAFYEVAGPKPPKGTQAGPMVRNPLYAELDGPVFGAIAMVTAASGHGHHVGFVYSKPVETQVVLLGGNQSDQIRFSPFRIAAVPASTKRVGKQLVRVKGHPDHLRFFVPAGYLDFAKGDAVLGSDTADALNAAYGIPVAKAAETTR